MTLREEPLPIVARCKKCGREFVALPQPWPTQDFYLPMCTPWNLAENTPPCGGEIVPVNTGPLV